jgi:hypothetical protein
MVWCDLVIESGSRGFVWVARSRVVAIIVKRLWRGSVQKVVAMIDIVERWVCVVGCSKVTPIRGWGIMRNEASPWWITRESRSSLYQTSKAVRCRYTPDKNRFDESIAKAPDSDARSQTSLQSGSLSRSDFRAVVPNRKPRFRSEAT